MKIPLLPNKVRKRSGTRVTTTGEDQGHLCTIWLFVIKNFIFVTFLKVESILLLPLPETDAFGHPGAPTEPAELRLKLNQGIH